MKNQKAALMRESRCFRGGKGGAHCGREKGFLFKGGRQGGRKRGETALMKGGKLKLWETTNIKAQETLLSKKGPAREKGRPFLRLWWD